MNRRVQDGWKEELLCQECEDRFNKWETPFAGQIFHRLNHDEALRFSPGPWFRYDYWCMKFAASVCWRVLTCFSKKFGINHLSAEQIESATRAADTWRSFLLDEIANPGPHELHMVIFDRLENHTCSELPRNFNRYLVRGVECDIVKGRETAFVYVKMCRVLIIGFFQKSAIEPWKGTKLRVRKGEIGGKDCAMPPYLLKYLCGRSNRLLELEARISLNQKAKIESSCDQNYDRMLNSESLHISLHDFDMFGPSAEG